jgi:hypothetical protein
MPMSSAVSAAISSHVRAWVANRMEAMLMRLPERERVGVGAWLEEGDLQRPLADRVVLAYELVHAAVPEQAVSVLVDVHAV